MLPAQLTGRADGAPWTVIDGASSVAPTHGDSSWPAHTLVIAGDAPVGLGAAAARLAEAHGWPIIAEPSSGARHGPNALRVGHLLLGEADWLRAHLPQRVLVVGHPTLHRQVGALTKRADIEVFVLAPVARWADSTRSAMSVLMSVPRPATDAGADPATDPAWLTAWQYADKQASTAMDAVLAAHPQLPETVIADSLLAALPPRALLVAGSSMPIRELACAHPREDVTVIANRGAAGIDGTVSTAIGAACAWQRDEDRPAFALVGDLTFLHDANGLIIGPEEPRPSLTIVVVNNAGGAIFAMLEQGAPAYADQYERIFGTPHGVDLAALCAATATQHTLVADLDALRAALPVVGPGIHVVEIQTIREGVRDLDQAVRAAVATAISG